MTDQERIDDLETRVKRFEDFFTFIQNAHTGQVGVMTQGRFGVMTSYWMQQPANHGAALSIGTIDDRYAVYAELDALTCPDAPSTVFSATVNGDNPTQRNISFESHCGGSRVANVDLYADGDGIQVGDEKRAWWTGRLGGAIKKLWP